MEIDLGIDERFLILSKYLFDILEGFVKMVLEYIVLDLLVY